jgi:HEAT repeat protein
LKRVVGIAACAMHGADPDAALAQALTDQEPRLRARAFRAAGELGWRDLLAAWVTGLQDQAPACRFRAARSAAEYLCLLDPGTPLFHLKARLAPAPAWQDDLGSRTVCRVYLGRSGIFFLVPAGVRWRAGQVSALGHALDDDSCHDLTSCA